MLENTVSFNLVIEWLFISGGGVILIGLLHSVSFNLVIEWLFISGLSSVFIRETGIGFQSRYRVAFHFRQLAFFYKMPSVIISFNLVIEWLFISGHLYHHGGIFFEMSFNLVIEWLFISGQRVFENTVRATESRFQSRYRVAFHFRYHVFCLPFF